MPNDVNRSKYFFRSLLPVFSFFCLMQLISIGVMSVIFFISSWTTDTTEYEGFIEYFYNLFMDYGSIFSLFIYGIAAFFISFFWYRHVYKESLSVPDFKQDSDKYELLTKDRQSLKNYKKSSIFAIIISAIGFQIVMQFFTVLLAKLMPSWAKMYEDLLEASGLDNSRFGWLVFIYVLFGPLSEEMCFRGLTYEYARKSMPFWGANFLQAFLFGLFHGNMLQGLMAFCLGLVLGYIYGKTRNIKLTIIFHVTFNFSTFFISLLDIKKLNMFTGFLYLMLGVILSYFSLIYFLRRVPRNYEKSSIDITVSDDSSDSSSIDNN